MIQNTQEVKRTLKKKKLAETRQNIHIFEEVLFFKLRTTTTTTTEEQTIQIILCQLNVGGWRKETGTRLTDVVRKRA